MKRDVIIDAGPLAAMLHRHDQYHVWVRRVLDQIKPPLLTCEACLSEAWFILRGLPVARAGLVDLLRREIIQAPFRLPSETKPVAFLLERYASVPMSFADACLVRLSELYPHSEVLTTDSDFNIYRRNGKEIIPVIMP